MSSRGSGKASAARREFRQAALAASRTCCSSFARWLDLPVDSNGLAVASEVTVAETVGYCHHL